MKGLFENVQKMKNFVVKKARYPLVESMAYAIIQNIMGYHGKIEKMNAIRLALSFHLLIGGPLFAFMMYFVGVIILTYYPDWLDGPYQFGILLGTIFGGLTLMFISPLLNLSIFSTITPKTFFERNNPKSTVIEYRFVTKILYGSIPLMIISSFIILILTTPSIFDQSDKIILFSKLIVLGIVTLSVMISISGLVTFGIPLLRKDFKLYLAKYSLALSLDIDDEIEKMQYVIFGLNTYNKYLKKILKLQIKNIDVIFKQIISEDSKKMNETIKDINITFTSNTFEPIRYFTKKFKISDNQFFTKITPKEKFIEWAPAMAITISFAFSFIQSLPTIIELFQKGIESIQNTSISITNSTSLLILLLS